MHIYIYNIKRSDFRNDESKQKWVRGNINVINFDEINYSSDNMTKPYVYSRDQSYVQG
uniref:Conserved domain protein n=1 Tax=Heterorhabditis bacteriophora TaxID=37862 RepID=A0A1I7WP14_HETBA